MAVRNPMEFESPNCAGTDPEAFWLEGGPSYESRAAKRVCLNCMHIDECLEWAVRHERDGMWGGTTPVERREIRRQRGILLQSLDTPYFMFARVS